MATQTAIVISSIPVYPTLSALALETGYIPVGQIASIESPSILVQATSIAPANGQFLAQSTSNAVYGAVTVYWVVFQSQDLIAGQSTPFLCRAAALSIAAYTGSGTGILTGSANGAFAAVDGVSLAVGDQLFLMPGLTNLTAKDAGPWVVVSLGGTSSKYQLARPYWWYTGNKWVSGQEIHIGGEGAFLQNTSWRATAASGVIDTTDSAFYVKEFTFQRKLSSGTLALAAGQPNASTTSATMPIGIYSATQSQIGVSLAIPSGTLTGTVSYGPTNASSSALCTPGYVGTAAGAVFALATAMATQTSDTSTVAVTVTNFS